MKYKIEVFWVAVCKDEPLYFVSGPFCNYDLAFESMVNMETPTGRCYLDIVSSTVEIESRGGMK